MVYVIRTGDCWEGMGARGPEAIPCRCQYQFQHNTSPRERPCVQRGRNPSLFAKPAFLTSTQSPNNPRGRNEFNPWVMEATFHKKREASDSETPGENKKKIPKRETLPCLNGSTPCYLRHISRMRRTLHSHSRLPFWTSLLP